VEIGGAHVKPGDLVVADGDRAIAVPQDVIDDVLKYAMQESENDRYDRRMLFDILKIPHDESVKPVFDVPPRHKSPDVFKKRLGIKD
jgi:4-hydroxy-4-methyl-2-oxoglutarate aldolase